MGRKKTFLIVDTETTQTEKVADIGCVVVDKEGNVLAQMGALVREFYLDSDAHPLFHSRDADPLWGRANLPARYENYQRMLNTGERVLASVGAVNRWLAKAAVQFRPVLTAYNLPFDSGKCSNSGIDLDIFEKRFCLWAASAEKWGKTKAYRQFVLDTVGFNKPTKLGNMSYHTNAEIMARFVLGQPELPDEPHTALEDALHYEAPILTALVKNTPVADYMNPPGYNWRNFQVKGNFKPA
tara:strand:- start:24984 stop:25703 length:720 start_codon:yes stop_codon:yes gene_type:complete